MGFTKIKDEDLARYPGVRGQETVPRISVEEKQAKFEERAEKVLRPAHDRLVDELEAPTAAKSLGAVTEDGAQSNVQDVIDNEVARAKAAEQSAATAAETAQTTAAAAMPKSGGQFTGDISFANGKSMILGGVATGAIVGLNNSGVPVVLWTDDNGTDRSWYLTTVLNTVASASSHVSSKSNPHSVTKSQVGLGKVNNNTISMSLSGTTLTISYS